MDRTRAKQRILLIIALFVIAAAGFAAHHALAQQAGQSRQTQAIPEAPIYQEIIIPGEKAELATSGFLRGRVRDLADYLGAIYNFLISIVGALAAVMMMIGGFQYLTAGGDKNKVDAGKQRIVNALIGMVLVLGSYVLLNTINPNLVNLKTPTVEKVTTEVAFLPFCDKLAKQMNISLDDIIVASARGARNVKGECGDAGFYTTKAQTATSTVESRLWCIFRGYRKGNSSDQNDYGQNDFPEPSGGPMLRVCAPIRGISSVTLEAEYKDKQVIATSVADEVGCQELTKSKIQQGLNWPIGDDACKMWQNIANNGDAQDNTFSLAKRGIIMDTRGGSPDRTKAMYYCGWSNDSAQRCDYSVSWCGDITKCTDYEDDILHWCEDTGRGEFTCTHETLGSKRFRDSGVVKHLYPVCNGNPCNVNDKCGVPGVAGAVGAVGGGDNFRIGLQIATGSLFGTVDCKGK